MNEFLALYNDNDELLEEKLLRSEKEKIEAGKHFRIVIVFIENSNKEFLIQRVSKLKGDCFATTGGHVQYGVSSLDTVVTEVEEELGLTIPKEEFKLIKTYKRSIAYQDVYYLKKDIDLSTLKLQDSEVEYVEWMSIDKIKNLIKEGEFRKGNIEGFKEIIGEN